MVTRHPDERGPAPNVNPGNVEADLEEAFEQGDVDVAVGLILSNHEQVLRDGRASELVGWVQRLPAEVLLSNPELSLVLGQAAGLSGDVVTAKVVLLSLRASSSIVKGSWPSAEVGLARLEASVRILEGDLARIREPFGFLDDASLLNRSIADVNVFAFEPITATIALGSSVRG